MVSARKIRLENRSDRLAFLSREERPQMWMDGTRSLRRLTPREAEVLRLIVAGRSTKQAAAELGITFAAAASYRAVVMEKLDVHNVANLVSCAISNKLI